MLAFLGDGLGRNGEPQMLEAWLARRPDEDLQLSATFWSGSATSSQIFEWIDGEVHVYGRSGNRLTEVIIHDPAHVRTKATLRFRDLQSDSTRDVERLWIQTSLASQQGRTIKGVSVSFALGDPIGTVLRKALHDAGVDAATSADVMREFTTFFSTFRHTVIRYAKGELGPHGVSGTMEAARARFDERMEALLGSRWTSALADAIMSNPKLLAMMGAVMQD